MKDPLEGTVLPAGIGDESMHHSTRLTPREIEVLRELARGRTARQAAAILGVSPHTVQTHAKRIYQKLSVVSRSQATLAAVRLGLVRP